MLNGVGRRREAVFRRQTLLLLDRYKSQVLEFVFCVGQSLLAARRSITAAPSRRNTSIRAALASASRRAADSGKGAEDTGAKVDDPEKGDALGAGAEKQEEVLGA